MSFFWFGSGSSGSVQLVLVHVRFGWFVGLVQFISSYARSRISIGHGTGTCMRQTLLLRRRHLWTLFLFLDIFRFVDRTGLFFRHPVLPSPLPLPACWHDRHGVFCLCGVILPAMPLQPCPPARCPSLPFLLHLPAPARSWKSTALFV